MTTSRSPICMGCTHFRPGGRPKGQTFGLWCDAFPAGTGIPQDILTNAFDHRQPHDGDHGITFDPVDAEAEEHAEEIFTPAAPVATITISPDADPANANWLRTMAAQKEGKRGKKA